MLTRNPIIKGASLFFKILLLIERRSLELEGGEGGEGTSTQTIPFLRLGHLALRVTDVARSRAFYQNLFMMKTVWEPDANQVYLSCGQDNLALHKRHEGQGAYNTFPKEGAPVMAAPLDHFGFIVGRKEEVDEMAERMIHLGIPIKRPVCFHRDGSYSFYIEDPDQNLIQILYEPNISQMSTKQ